MNAQKIRTVVTLVACAGVGATAGVAIYDAKHYDPCRPKWKNYGRTVGVATATIVCIGASHKIGTKQIATIAGAAAGAKKLYDKYEDKVKEVIGEVKNEEIKKEVAKDRAKERLANTDYVLGEGYQEYFYEPATDQWFYCTREGIRSAQNELCNEFIHDPEDFESKDNECVMAGVLLSRWIELLIKHGAKGLRKCPEYDKPKIGWFWGDGDAYWDYNWGFFGGPWVTVNFEEIFEGDDGYTMLDYGPMAPTFMDSDGGLVMYKKEMADAKMRWENEYA